LARILTRGSHGVPLTEKEMPDICRLCKSTAPLKRSHILPKGLYKKLLDRRAKNPHPIHISPEKAVQSSRQITEYMLCEKCEQRFSDNGEKWMLANCFDGRSLFPLRESILARAAVRHGKEFSSVAGARVPELANHQLKYFAASVFWRASIRNRMVGAEGSNEVDLGRAYEEEFRRYLIGESSFPARSALLVCLSSAHPPSNTFSYPATMPHHPRGCHAHRLVIPGICFDLHVGKAAVAAHRVCFVHSPEHFVFFTTAIESWIAESCFKLVGLSLHGVA
jgi:hypothetical protein